jgi:mono/diheme cytochrome c family protein
MSAIYIPLAVVLASISCVAMAADAPPGKQIFDRHCAACHAAGVGMPGTQQLGWTRGKEFAVLEERKDLQADYVRFVVRQGLLEMPPFRPTEIDDEQLARLADYLAKRGRRSKR